MKDDRADAVTRALAALRDGNPQAGEQLLPLVYDELHALASAQMAREQAGHALQTTALVHEAYLRLVANEDARWENRRHYFGAAAEAMRRILIDEARRRSRLKRGGGRERVPWETNMALEGPPSDELLALEEALAEFEEAYPRQAEVVKLRYFVGLTLEETASILDVTRSTVSLDWRFARAWLQRRIDGQESS